MIILPILILILGNSIPIVGYFAIYLFLDVSLLIGITLLTGRSKKYTMQFEVLFCFLFLVMMSVIGHS